MALNKLWNLLSITIDMELGFQIKTNYQWRKISFNFCGCISNGHIIQLKWKKNSLIKMFSQTFVQLWYILIFNFNWNLHFGALLLDCQYMWIWEAWKVWNMENAHCSFVLTPIASALADDVSLCVLSDKRWLTKIARTWFMTLIFIWFVHKSATSF